jgi:hypothetical protein
VPPPRLRLFPSGSLNASAPGAAAAAAAAAVAEAAASAGAAAAARHNGATDSEADTVWGERSQLARRSSDGGDSHARSAPPQPWGRQPPPAPALGGATAAVGQQGPSMQGWQAAEPSQQRPMAPPRLSQPRPPPAAQQAAPHHQQHHQQRQQQQQQQQQQHRPQQQQQPDWLAPGTLLWAKMPLYPWWPCVCLAPDDTAIPAAAGGGAAGAGGAGAGGRGAAGRVPVRFFGPGAEGESRGWVVD